MQSKVKTFIIITAIILFCGIMAVIDGIMQANYVQKSVIKLGLFLFIPAIFSIYNKEIDLWSVLKVNKSGIKFAISLCIPIYIIIVGGYLLLKDIFDFSAITTSLTNNIGVTKDNFIYVSLYISFVNSFLEEFFFRGFAFLTLGSIFSKKIAFVFSAAMFSIYHVAMMIGWFSVWVFILVLAGLFAGGLIFNFLDDKSRSIYPSWFVHMFANFAINTIGFMLFDII